MKSEDRSLQSLSLYLKQVREASLLTADEEKDLARRIKAGDQAAYEKLVVSNLRLVISIAKAYANRGLDFLDLVQEGNLGLLHGAKKFSADKGFRISTYASWWIRQGIERALFTYGHTIRIPVHQAEMLKKIERIANKLSEKSGIDPSIEEIAAVAGMTREKVQELLNIRFQIISTESLISDDGDGTFLDGLSFEQEDPDEDISRQELISFVRSRLEVLSERESMVVCRRYGILGDNPETLQEIAATMEITRERVRQIELEAFKKLRQSISKADFRNHGFYCKKAV